MRILCVCKMGRNRSRYLAGYLASRGHKTRYAGVSRIATRPLQQEDIDWAQLVITAKGWMRDRMFERYGCKEKRIIALDVDDNPLLIGPQAIMSMILDPNSEYQERFVYCKLRRQVKRHVQ
jgi:predicted protein tyrosine phosphatase